MKIWDFATASKKSFSRGSSIFHGGRLVPRITQRIRSSTTQNFLAKTSNNIYHYIRVPVRGISLTQNMLYSGTAGGLCSVYVVGISQFKPVFNLHWGGGDGGTFLFHLLYPSHSLFSQVPTPCPPLLRYQDQSPTKKLILIP